MGLIETIIVKIGYEKYNFTNLGLEQAIAFSKMAVMTSDDGDMAVVNISYEPEGAKEETEEKEEESEDE